VRFDARKVCAHPTVLALSEPARLVLLALLREASRWGEIEPGRAAAITKRTLAEAKCTETARDVLAQLHTVRLAHRDNTANVIVLWTPVQRDDADLFAVSDAELSALETEVNGPVPGLTAAESEAL
jgi:hypothetical protein